MNPGLLSRGLPRGVYTHTLSSLPHVERAELKPGYLNPVLLRSVYFCSTDPGS